MFINKFTSHYYPIIKFYFQENLKLRDQHDNVGQLLVEIIRGSRQGFTHILLCVSIVFLILILKLKSLLSIYDFKNHFSLNHIVLLF